MIDKAALLAPRSITSVRDVEVEGIGTVRVRALTRAEVLEIQVDAAKAGNSTADLIAFEHRIVSLALVDPAMTVDEVAQWYQVAPAGELEVVTAAINQLSGLEGRAAKAAFPSV